MIKERYPVSVKEQIRDAALITFAGGIIGILSAFEGAKVLSAANVDIISVIRDGLFLVGGAGLAEQGVEHLFSKKS